DPLASTFGFDHDLAGLFVGGHDGGEQRVEDADSAVVVEAHHPVPDGERALSDVDAGWAYRAVGDEEGAGAAVELGDISAAQGDHRHITAIAARLVPVDNHRGAHVGGRGTEVQPAVAVVDVDELVGGGDAALPDAETGEGV